MIRINFIVLTESKNVDDFYPFSVLHPLWELRYGAFRMFEKVEQEFPGSVIIYRGRKNQTELFRDKFDVEDRELQKGNILIINSAALIDSTFWDELSRHLVANPNQTFMLKKDNVPVAAYLHESNYVENLEETDITNLDSMFLNNFKIIEAQEMRLLKYLYEIIYLIGDAIDYDYQMFRNHAPFSDMKFPGVILVKNKMNIKIGKNVRISPTVVIDTTGGPVIIDDNAYIMPQATILGPAYIGKNTIVKVGAKIYPQTCIGEYCKVGGEIEDVVFQGYSNKQHDGFLGHSFISEWVNLGADTNNSDLKNTYGRIKLRFKGKTVDTGEMFMGLLCGDHTKTAINTRFNTGTVCGIGAIIFEADFPPVFIPSFTWGGDKTLKAYKVENAIDTAKVMMKRRAKKLHPIEAALMKEEHAKRLK